VTGQPAFGKQWQQAFSISPLKRHGKLRESRPGVRTSAAPSFHTTARVLLARESFLVPGLNPARRKLSARRLFREELPWNFKQAEHQVSKKDIKNKE